MLFTEFADSLLADEQKDEGFFEQGETNVCRGFL